MNLLNDLSSELAVAFLIDKKYSEKMSSNEALNLIGRICEILEPISAEAESSNYRHLVKKNQITNH